MQVLVPLCLVEPLLSDLDRPVVRGRILLCRVLVVVGLLNVVNNSLVPGDPET